MPTYIRGYTLGSNRAKKRPDTGESGETYDTETLSERLRRPARNDQHHGTLIRKLIKVQAVAWSVTEQLVTRLFVNIRQTATTFLKAIVSEVEARFKGSELRSHKGIKEIVRYVEERRSSARN